MPTFWHNCVNSDRHAQSLDPPAAAAILEQFRYGLPPTDHLAHFTAASASYRCTLRQRLYVPPAVGRSGLVEAGGGGGKSHLLRFLRDVALDAGYAVSLIDLPQQEGVRLDQIDTIFGVICQQVHTPVSVETGIGGLFGAFARPPTGGSHMARLRQAITTRGRWDYATSLGSSALYVALRAWVMGDSAARSLVEAWLSDPAAFQTRRTFLYDELVYRLRDRFSDPRPPRKVTSEAIELMDASGSDSVWDALAGLDVVARASGLRGLVVLLDGLDRVDGVRLRTDQRLRAQQHILRLFEDRLPGIRYATAAPEFRERWHREATQSGSREVMTLLAQIPSITPPELTEPELRELAARIRTAHGMAYDWHAEHGLADGDLDTLVARLCEQAGTDDMRHLVQGVVSTLDSRLERSI